MAAFDFAKVKDPTFFKENVLNAHASFRTYASREEYLAGESSLAMKLDGIWKFAYAKNDRLFSDKISKPVRSLIKSITCHAGRMIASVSKCIFET